MFEDFDGEEGVFEKIEERERKLNFFKKKKSDFHCNVKFFLI